MQTYLPTDARIKSWNHGEIKASQVETGMRVLGYNIVSKDFEILTITGVTSEDASQNFELLIHGLMIWVKLAAKTMVNTPKGSQAIEALPNMLTSYCVFNPKRLSDRLVVDCVPYVGTAHLITWDATSLLIAEGLLVGQ
jgi:hypothetical protein